MVESKFNILETIKTCVRWVAWRGFLWSIGKTAEEYWSEIVEQEADCNFPHDGLYRLEWMDESHVKLTTIE